MSGSNQCNVKIAIATHKKYDMPSDNMYLPLHVGAEGKTDVTGKPLDLGYTKDSTGDNISVLNSSFCELTGLYWMWKNTFFDYVGLVHYRRHFSFRRFEKNKLKSVLKYDELEPMLGKYRIFLPKKRRYYIETLYSHYGHTHYSEHLDMTYRLIEKKYPEYADSFRRVMKQRYGYMFNMMIMERALLDEYCEWLFDILFSLSEQIDDRELSAFQGRFYGRVSEIILNVWIDYQVTSKKLSYKDIKEIPCIHMEKINWFKKGFSFLKAKFFKQKYEGSF